MDLLSLSIKEASDSGEKTSSGNGSQPKGFKVFIKRDGGDAGGHVFYEDI
jgi:hypothetical protein